MMDWLLHGILAIAALLVCVIPHEVSHGYVAYRLGDPTAKAAGRLTANPIPHLDPIGSFLVPGMLIVLGQFTGVPLVFGWAKPVPVNANHFRGDPWRGMLLVALAGPGANLAMAGATAVIGRGLVAAGFTLQVPLLFLALVVLYSLVLAFFNSVPVPPLDGSRVLAYFLPPKWRMLLSQLEPYGMFIILALLMVGGLSLVFRLASGLWSYLLGFEWALHAGLM
ncbi:MAG: site-2 protease family protein [Candidatus Bipolaricaulota bacterium]